MRFPIQASWQTLAGIAQLQERLRTEFPIMERQQVTQLAISIGPSVSAIPNEDLVNWQFQSDDGHGLLLEPGSATLSAGSSYANVDRFEHLFKIVLNSLTEVGPLPRCDRLGVRYLNLVNVVPGDDDSWKGWFRSELVGWVGAGVLGEQTQLSSSLTQTQLAAPNAGGDAIQGIVHHGLLPAGVTMAGVPPIQVETPSFLLDIDLFVPTPQAFEVERLLAQFRELHEEIERFFRWSLTPAGEEHFALEVTT